MRTNGLLKADKPPESSVPASKELLENLGRFIDEVTNAGVLYATDATDGLHTSAKGDRVQLSGLF